MYTTSFRKVGGSVMMVVPPALLDTMQLNAGSKVGLVVENGRLIVEPITRPRYSLAELIAQCDSSAPDSAEGQAWLESKPLGNERL